MLAKQLLPCVLLLAQLETLKTNPLFLLPTSPRRGVLKGSRSWCLIIRLWCHISSFFLTPIFQVSHISKTTQCFWSFSLTFSSSRIMMTMMMMMMAMMVMMMMVMTMMVIAGRQMSIAAWCCLSCPPPAGFYNGARGSALSALHSSLAMEGVLQYKAAMHWSHLRWIAKELPTLHCKRQPPSECT